MRTQQLNLNDISGPLLPVPPDYLYAVQMARYQPPLQLLSGSEILNVEVPLLFAFQVTYLHI